MEKNLIAILTLILAVCAAVSACIIRDDGRNLEREGQQYLAATVQPCLTRFADSADPCAAKSDFNPQGLVPMSLDPGKTPPTFVRVLNATLPYADDDYPVAGIDLASAKHIVLRGVSKEGTMRCESYPVMFPAWAVAKDDAGASPADFQHPIPATWRHMICLSDIEVHEYFVGEGPAELTVSHGSIVAPYDGADADPNDEAELKELLEDWAVVAIEGNEWVLWLSPSHLSALESWRATEYWDVQRTDGGKVLVVSPFFDWFSDMSEDGFKKGEHSLLAPTIEEFRNDIAEAHNERIAITEGRIGVSEHTPMLVADANKLSDYFNEYGAYDHPEVTPAPPPRN